MKNNAKRAIQRAALAHRALTNHTFHALARRHPDADWSVDVRFPWNSEPEVKVTGYIYIITNPDLVSTDEDIRDIANACSTTSYEWNGDIERAEARIGKIRAIYTVRLSVSQRMSDSDRDLLRALGNLKRVYPDQVSYDTLVCNSH